MRVENDILPNLYSALEHNSEKSPDVLKYWAMIFISIWFMLHFRA